MLGCVCDERGTKRPTSTSTMLPVQHKRVCFCVLSFLRFCGKEKQQTITLQVWMCASSWRLEPADTLARTVFRCALRFAVIIVSFFRSDLCFHVH